MTRRTDVFGQLLDDVRGATRTFPTGPRLAVLGNCQAAQMSRCLQALANSPEPRHQWVTEKLVAKWQNGRGKFERFFDQADYVFIQPWIWSTLRERYAHLAPRVAVYPSIAFMAYQPDLVPVLFENGEALHDGPLQVCNSSLAFLGWRAGLDESATAALFRDDVFRRLGFYDYWSASETALLEEGRAAQFPLEALLAQWRRSGCFMYCHVHPKMRVLGDVARGLLERLGVPLAPGDPLAYAHDYLSNGPAWPVYPEIARALGIEGHYAFKCGSRRYYPDLPVNMLGLEPFIAESFKAYRGADKELTCQRLELASYRKLLAELQKHPVTAKRATATAPTPAAVATAELAAMHAAKRAAHPYADIPAHQRWRNAVVEVAPEQIDPVTAAKFRIEAKTRVATAGSCFAQRISESLRARGFNYLLTEPTPFGMADAEAERRGYGEFTARFGFLYSARQLRQLFERAFGAFVPQEDAWRRDDGHYVDPFRPRVEPEGFATREALVASRKTHLAAVRRMFETLEVFVFTLGLTEAWRDRRDGAVFPLAPGVAGGTPDPERHEFVNFTVAEVDADLEALLQQLKAVNPNARVILTVSPVPLAATAEPRHVLVASTYSKAVLRVAADQVARRHAHCDYFPSYEIVTGPFHRGRYIADDLRSVTPEGADHIMRVFFRHYAGVAEPGVDAALLAEARRNVARLCDEDFAAAQAAGARA